MKVLLLILLIYSSLPASAAEWVYEFEFGTIVNASRLQRDDCTVAYTFEDGYWHHWSCGGGALMYHHFLGVKCWRPLPKLEMWCGWRHKSHVLDGSEIYYDAFSVKGSFEFGKRRKR